KGRVGQVEGSGVEGVLRRDPRREQGDQHEEREHRRRGHGRPRMPEAVQHVAAGEAPPARWQHLARHRVRDRNLVHLTRTRGSTRKYSRSTTVLMATKSSAIIMR